MRLLILLGLATLAVPGLARKRSGTQDDFQFVEDGKDKTVTSSGTGEERRTWILDPDNKLCGLLMCDKREQCLLQDRFTAVCVNKVDVMRNGDKIIPLKSSGNNRDGNSPTWNDIRSFRGADDEDDDDNDDDDEDDDDDNDAGYNNHNNNKNNNDDDDDDDQYILDDDDDDEDEDENDDDNNDDHVVNGKAVVQADEDADIKKMNDQPTSRGSSSSSSSILNSRTTLNRRPFARKQCPSCPVVRPIFLCGTDNRTYSSLCRLHYHNCIHEATVRIACKGFCPCPEVPNHGSRKDHQHDHMGDSVYGHLDSVANEDATSAGEGIGIGTGGSSSSLKGGSSTQDRTGEQQRRSRNKTDRGAQRARGDQDEKRSGGVGGREKDRSRYGKIKGSSRTKYGKYAKYIKKHSKDNNNFRNKDSYGEQRRDWESDHYNDVTHKGGNNVWGPNECSQDALAAMGNRMLDWFSVIMSDARSHSSKSSKAPVWCKPEVAWMLGHLDNDEDSQLNVKELYQLEHDDRERCIKPFIDRCDLDRDVFLSGREWCKCFDKSERPCAALRKASKGLMGGYIPECDSEGYYRLTQCHGSVSWCWCVDKHGVEIPGSRTRGKPSCDVLLANQLVNHNRVDDDAEEEGDDGEEVEGSADMPLDI